MMNKKNGVHFKSSPVRADTNRGGAPWAVSSPPSISQAMRQFEMHPRNGGAWMFAVLFFFIVSFQKRKSLESSKITTVKITFNNKVKNYKITLHDSVYTNPFGEKYTITKLRYYISDISLISDGKVFSEKNSYHLIDESDQESKSFSLTIAEGNYSSLKFLLGVDSLHNVSGAQIGALDPAKDMFWTWNTGYVMAKLEGNSPSSTLVNNKYEYHIGGFAGKYNVLKNIELNFSQNKPMHFAAGKKTEIIINADINTWWQNPNDIKIAGHANITSPGKLALMISDNYAKMFHIEKIISE